MPERARQARSDVIESKRARIGIDLLERAYSPTAVPSIRWCHQPTLLRADVQAATSGVPADTGFYFRFSDESYRIRQQP
jgi:hypothetical protein